MRSTGIALLCVALSGCVTVAEFRKLENEVIDMQRGGGPAPQPGERLADIGTRLDELERRLGELQGRLEVAEHRSEEALSEARAARGASASANASPAPDAVAPDEMPEEAAPGASPEEVQAYREAYAAWRAGDATTCVDRFRQFLQTYADSTYADDAAYWMADCYFKHGDYKTAILRFDDVAARYPSGNKAADALYRQGEALLRLGPGYGKAAGKAFERVLSEYPDSARAPEAKRQLDLLRSG
jgi:tol-pal system protein YbgF